jgi:glycosyltransferase involved in cell wall biosynthesis
MKRVLIISYYWPPAGGAGVQRWLKMTKYLPEFGWSPLILAPEHADHPVIDESLQKDIHPQLTVLRQKVWEPYFFYKLLTGRKTNVPMYSGFIDESATPGLLHRLSLWVRGNLFIPDARKFWIRPSVSFLKRYLREHPVDAIVSTGPPHSTHMIAMAIAKQFELPWTADFRDPWTAIDYYDKLQLSAWAHARHRRLERQVLQSATDVVTVSDSWATDLGAIGQRQVTVITNGYDPSDFEQEILPDTDYFRLAHIGAFNSDRNIGALWLALAELGNSGHPLIKQLRVDLIGPVDRSIRQAIDRHKLAGLVNFRDFIPHAEAVKSMRRSHLLLLPVNNTPNAAGLIPGKFFEYLAARRPILVFGPSDGDCARICLETGAGRVVDFDDVAGIKQALQHYFERYENATAPVSHANIEPFSRRELARDYASLLSGQVHKDQE